MTSSAPGAAGTWSLRRARERDIDQLMRWFPGEVDIRNWGGPDFRHPFTRHSFVEDMDWGRTDSFSLLDADNELTAFGQLYERLGRIHLARLVVDPPRRNSGIGRVLVDRLLEAGRDLFGCAEFSLFVFRDNTVALACYRSMGFRTTEYPGDMPLADECYYLTRPVDMACAPDLQSETTRRG